jgi:hypothetical protein
MDLDFSSWPNTVSSVIAIIGTSIVVLFPFIIFYIIRKARKNPKSLDNVQTKQHYGGLYQIYKTDSLLTSSFAVVKLTRKLVFAVCLVFLQQHQTL